MRNKKISIGWTAVLAIFAVTLLATSSWAAAKEKALYNFDYGNSKGYQPEAGLIFDAAGNLYGTTSLGGANQYAGAVFELTPKAGGGWTEKVLHSFGNGLDGDNPYAGLIFDADGNLYGTTLNGGSFDVGTVFKLTPPAAGKKNWTEKVLHNFQTDGTDGMNPKASLVLDASGNLYGTTQNGGSYSAGTVFELSPKTGGGWKEKVLHSFNLNGADGVTPDAGLTFDSSGNLYGATLLGGTGPCEVDDLVVGCGTVFELSPVKGGLWSEKILYSFNFSGTDGWEAMSSLIFDTAGNLYGTTFWGGKGQCAQESNIVGCGTVFELTPAEGGGWKERVLHSFDNTDGNRPVAGVIFGAGNLYGTTLWGGNLAVCNDTGCGTVFELTPAQGDGWEEKVLHSFGNGLDGDDPYAGLIFDADGNLYGTASEGGTFGLGMVFELTP